MSGSAPVDTTACSHRRRFHLRLRPVLLLVVLTLLLPSLVIVCVSRYKMNLYLVAESQRKKVKVEQTEFIPGMELGDPTTGSTPHPGERDILMVATGVRGRRAESESSRLFSFDEYLRCRLFVQLPKDFTAGTIAAQKNSFVQIMGRFDQPLEERIYTGRSGSITVDSVNSKHLYASIDALYRNSLDDSLRFDGRFRVKLQ